MLGLHWCLQAFSKCCKWELLSSYSAQASQHYSFSCCKGQAIGPRAQQLRCTGSASLWHSGSSWTGNRTYVPLHWWILNHWNTREVQHSVFVPCYVKSLLYNRLKKKKKHRDRYYVRFSDFFFWPLPFHDQCYSCSTQQMVGRFVILFMLCHHQSRCPDKSGNREAAETQLS